MKFSHQVLLLQFITDDFYRMQRADFAGYAKPVLDIVNGKLVVTNVPVPRRSHYLTWIARHVQNLKRIRTIEFVNRSFRKAQVSLAGGADRVQEAADRKTRDVLRKIFEELKALQEEKSIQPVLVYLPALHEMLGNGRDFEAWVEFLHSESQAFGIPLFDVLSDFRQLPVHQIVSMYIPVSESGPNHFNEAGNTFVARIIYNKFLGYLPIAEMLSPSPPGDPSSLTESSHAHRTM